MNKQLSNYILIAVTVIFILLNFSRNSIWATTSSLWKDASEKSPMIARTHINYGEALVKDENFVEAINVLKKSLEADKNYIEGHSLLADSYIKIKQFNKAIPYLKEVVRINNILSRGHFGSETSDFKEFKANADLGNIFNMMEKYREAIIYYNMALEIYPDDTNVRFNLALTYSKTNQRIKAKEEFKKILEINPQDEGANYYYNMLSKPQT